MPQQTALLAGATGLVGRKLLEQLLADPAWREVRVLTRRPIAHEDPRLSIHVTDFDQIDVLATENPGLFNVDAIFCCLGTTLKTAGSKQAFERVDHDYVVNLARAGDSCGALRFLMVSAIGADSRSLFFYNRTKGRAEDAVSSLGGYEAIHFMQPSLLLGERSEHRPGEAVSQKLSPVFSPLLAGPLARYRPVQAATVAEAMAKLASSGDTGCHRHLFNGSTFS